MNLEELQAFVESNLERDVRPAAQTAAVKLVPRPAVSAETEPADIIPPATLRDRLLEIEMAQQLGYLLCKCSWPPQIMVLTGSDHIYRCRRCSRVREM